MHRERIARTKFANWRIKHQNTDREFEEQREGGGNQSLVRIPRAMQDLQLRNSHKIHQSRDHNNLRYANYSSETAREGEKTREITRNFDNSLI